jgi:O-antigen/teichoic acid export membrane protein
MKADEKNTTAKDDNHFETDHLKDNLKGRSLRGGAIVMSSQVIKFLLRMGATIIVARLLTPADFGLVGMVTVVTGFVALFKDLGLSFATVQHAEINHAQVSTLFWINVAVSVFLLLVVAGLAPAITWFYKEPSLTYITLALSLNFIFGGLTIQHQALLKRQMRFAALNGIEVFAVLINLIITILAALYGARYWAIVIGQLAFSFSVVVGTWLKCDWRPSLPVRGANVRPMLVFGGNLSAFRVLNYFSRNLDNLLIGRFVGAGALGLYDKAYQLLLLPIQQINWPATSVAVPVLSRLQNEPERFRAYYLQAIQMLVTVTMPAVAFLFVTADMVIPFLLGNQWVGSVIIFRYLAPAAFIGTFNVATGWVYISLGQTGRQFRWSILGSSVTITSFLIGIHWGVIGVAAAFSIKTLILLIPRLLYCYRLSPLRLRDLINALSIPALCSIFAALGLFVMLQYVISENINTVIRLVSAFLLYFCCYLTAWLVTPKGRIIFLQTCKLVGENIRGDIKKRDFLAPS